MCYSSFCKIRITYWFYRSASLFIVGYEVLFVFYFEVEMSKICYSTKVPLQVLSGLKFLVIKTEKRLEPTGSKNICLPFPGCIFKLKSRFLLFFFPESLLCFFRSSISRPESTIYIL